MKKVLIVDDDAIIRKMFTLTLEEAGYKVLTAEDGSEGLHLAIKEQPLLILTDFQMPRMNGLELLDEVVKRGLEIPVIMLTGYGDLSLTIKAIQRGAYEYLEKPTTPEHLIALVDKVAKSAEYSRVQPNLIEESKELERQLEKNLLIGRAPQMKEIFKRVGVISQTKVNVLVEGETGTGKELVTRLIHQVGVTRDQPFVVVNCSTLTETLLESELFGHVKGAFTDSIRDKPGKFELAGEGTIFLDEISEVSLSTQVKLLRVIQEQEFERVGGEETIPMKARVIAATNKNLEELIQEGRFRADLYYRLNVMKITIPPLRDRKDDIEELVIHFLYKLNQKFGKGVTKLGEGVIELLEEHNWPGNVRELENVILQGIVMSKTDVLEKGNILINRDLITSGSFSSLYTIRDLESRSDKLFSLAEMEEIHIKHILESCEWNKVRASSVLGISRPTLDAKINRYNIVPD